MWLSCYMLIFRQQICPHTNYGWLIVAVFMLCHLWQKYNTIYVYSIETKADAVTQWAGQALKKWSAEGPRKRSFQSIISLNAICTSKKMSSQVRPHTFKCFVTVISSSLQIIIMRAFILPVSVSWYPIRTPLVAVGRSHITNISDVVRFTTLNLVTGLGTAPVYMQH